MTRYFRRTNPTLPDNLTAGLIAAGLAVGVGAVTFYLVRLLLAREELESLPPGRGERGSSAPGGDDLREGSG